MSDQQNTEETTKPIEVEQQKSITGLIFEHLGFTEQDAEMFNKIIAKHLASAEAMDNPAPYLDSCLVEIKQEFMDKEEKALFILGYAIGQGILRYESMISSLSMLKKLSNFKECSCDDPNCECKQ